MSDQTEIHRAIGRLEGEMSTMRTQVAGVDIKLDTVILQTATLRAERAADHKRHTRIIAIVAPIGTFIGAMLAKLTGHA